MLSILRPPIGLIRKRFTPRSSALDAPPPPDIISQPFFGDYTIKATVRAKDETYVGYAQDLSIAEKTLRACQRFGKECSQPEITFKGGKSTEVIYVKRLDGTMRRVA